MKGTLKEKQKLYILEKDIRKSGIFINNLVYIYAKIQI